MTPAKHEAKLRGQTTIAQKVFEMVPIQEAWTGKQILSALHRVTRSAMDYRILQGCLVALKDAGLICEPKAGLFRRAEVKEKEVKMPAINLKPEAEPADAPSPKRAPVEILSGIASHLRMLASDIETAALEIEEGIAAKEADMGKLRQLQSLLKSLA